MNRTKSALFNHADFHKKLQSSDSSLSVFKASITEAKETLKKRHFAGASSMDIVSRLTWFMDQIMEQAWQQHTHLLPEKVF